MLVAEIYKEDKEYFILNNKTDCKDCAEVLGIERNLVNDTIDLVALAQAKGMKAILKENKYFD